jgi:hypothetical protein
VLPTLQTFAPRFEIYTDARGNLAHEWGTEQLGGLLCGPGGYEYFMVPVSQICEGTLKAGGQHRINQCEAAAALVAISTWADTLRGSHVTLYIDNCAAEGVLNKGSSSSWYMARISATFWRVAEQHDIGIWICHVPSKLNPSDPLSRGDADIAVALGATRRQACCEEVSTWGWSY